MLRSTADELKRAVPDKPSRDPKDHPARIPEEAEPHPTARLLLLLNYRPEYEHTWHRRTYYQQLRLDPLPSASAEALLEALLGEDPSLTPLKRLLIARTEGNPFFVEESVRALMEAGVLAGEHGAGRAGRPHRPAGAGG